MSAITFSKLFEPVNLTGGTDTLYTVAGASTTILRNAVVRISNNTASTRLIDVYAVPFEGAASTSNAVVYLSGIAPYDYIDVEIPELKIGDIIQAKIDTNDNVVAHYLSGNLYAPS